MKTIKDKLKPLRYCAWILLCIFCLPLVILLLIAGFIGGEFKDIWEIIFSYEDFNLKEE